MPTFERCPKSVEDMAKSILKEFETHKPLITAGVTVDYVFARANVDDQGNRINDALSKNGIKALGITRKIPLKDRSLGRADAEVALDGDWWDDANDGERRALLDHELHHIEIRIDKRGVVRDDLGRPSLKLRHHDVDFGWFKIIAQRHGAASQERIQAKSIMDNSGQYFWPEISEKVFGTVTIEGAGKSITMSSNRFSNIAKDMAKGKP